MLNVLTYSKYIHVRLPYTCVYDLSKSMSFSSTILTFLSKEEIKLGGGASFGREYGNLGLVSQKLWHETDWIELKNYSNTKHKDTEGIK